MSCQSFARDEAMLLAVRAHADPAFLPKLLGLFAKLDHVPHAVRAGREGDEVWIEVETVGFDPERMAHFGRQIATWPTVIDSAVGPCGRWTERQRAAA